VEAAGVGLARHQGFGRVLAWDPALGATMEEERVVAQQTAFEDAQGAGGEVPQGALVALAEAVVGRWFAGALGAGPPTALGFSRLAALVRAADEPLEVALALRAAGGLAEGGFNPMAAAAIVDGLGALPGFAGAPASAQLAAWGRLATYLEWARAWRASGYAAPWVEPEATT
jgi:hypothetical protein